MVTRAAVLRTVLFVVLVVLVAPFVAYAVPSLVGAQHSYVVLSGSMEPKMNPGDVVFVSNVRPAKIEKGDIITFQRPGEKVPTTHRVHSIQRKNGHLAFQTKGDANENPDEGLVTKNRVVGRVTLIIPYIGYVIQFANTPAGFVVLVAGPIGALLVSEAWSLVRGASETDDRDDSDGPDPDADVERVTNVEADSEPESITVTARDVQISGVLTGLFAVYAGYTAYKRLDPLSAAVAVACATLFVFMAMLYVATDEELPVRDGSVPDSVLSGTVVEVDSFSELVEMAEESGRWIVADDDAGGYVLVTDDVAYRYPIDEPEDVSDPVDEDEVDSDSDGGPAGSNERERRYDSVLLYGTPVTDDAAPADEGERVDGPADTDEGASRTETTAEEAE